jgi:phosphoribosylamine--glycine ligase
VRFLSIGDDAALTDMYLRLGAGGHQVRVFAADAAALPLKNTIDYVPDWRSQLSWIRDAGNEGIIIFETARMGDLQDELRRQGYHVIGGCAFGDRLETDRAFGQHCMRAAGLGTVPMHGFADFEAGIAYVKAHPGRYVFKLNGAGFSSGRNYVGELDDGRDIIAVLARNQATWHSQPRPTFVLMDHVEGVEVGVGAYFNGEAFMDPVVIDWEHKRFFNGDLGELTGEMGTLVSYEHAGPLFDATLARMKQQLCTHGYVGYINLNTIVNSEGIWPLEFTCRFGDPGYAICDALHAEGWDALFHRMVARDRRDFAVRPGFAVGVVLTVPPFPHASRYAELSKGQEIFFRTQLSAEDRRNLHLNEVDLRDGRMFTGGEVGYLMVVTGSGHTVEAARERAYGLAAHVVTPNLRYRTDIGLRFDQRDRALLQEFGLWPR